MKDPEGNESFSIIDRFDEHCLAFGDNDAVIGQQQDVQVGLTELQYTSKALAAQLWHRYRPSHVVIDMDQYVVAEAVGVLACLRICVPFCPVDSQVLHQAQRLTKIAETLQSSTPNTRVVAVVCGKDDNSILFQNMEAAGISTIVCLSPLGDLLEPMSVPDSLPGVQFCDDMYIIFTSGTSGNTPKAVIGSQKSTVNRLKWFANKFPPSKANLTVIARKTKLTFVDGLTELLSGLLFADTLLYSFTVKELAAQGPKLVLSSPCTQMTLLPSQLNQILTLTATEGTPTALPPHNLDTVIVSGEMCPPALLEKFRQHFTKSTKLVNLYGQTESTGDATCAILTSMEHPVVNNTVSVGEPIVGTTLTLNTTNQEVVVAGNLCNGYLNGGTANEMGEHLTGDTGFCRDGNWYIRGRIDNVSKINGIWTSPSEVEDAFMQVYPDVCECAATITEQNSYVVMPHLAEFEFSRSDMYHAGVPGHLIPKTTFFVDALPKIGGAGKIDRAAIKRFVGDMHRSRKSAATPPGLDGDRLLLLASAILGVPVTDDTSFVDAGGDIASAVALFHRMRKAGLIAEGNQTITCLDILQSESLGQLRKFLRGEPLTKRRRVSAVKKPVTRNNKNQSETVENSKCHWSIAFPACVDAAVAVHTDFMYGGCQAGRVQKIDIKSKTVDAVTEFDFAIQSDLRVNATHDSIIVCGYKGSKGSVVALRPDDLSLIWKQTMDGPIKASAALDDKFAYVAAGEKLCYLDLETGTLTRTVSLPAETESRPALVHNSRGTLVAVACSEWEVGLSLISETGTDVISEISCPVYADLLSIGRGDVVVVADVQGSLHRIDTCTLEVKTKRFSSSPVYSGPSLLNDETIVFGCHDSTVRCVHARDLSELWKFDAHAVVYSRPLAFANSTDHLVIVCTTAGDVYALDASNGEEVYRTLVSGEIWSDCLEVSRGKIAFGARDSRVHVIQMQV